MHQYLTEWLLLTSVVLLAVISPGPDLAVTIRNAIKCGRRAGIMTAFGIGLGIVVHTTYCIIGIAAVISQSILLFSLIKYMGAAYLVYIGLQGLRSQGTQPDNLEAAQNIAKVPAMSSLQALRSGFITNLLNPKATLFFLALFTQIIDPHTPQEVQVVYAATTLGIAATWFSLISIILTNPTIRNRFLAVSKWFDRVCGAALIALGIRLALTRH